MATITEVLQALNIIDLLNILLPPGIGELLVLIVWCASFAIVGAVVAVWALSKERIWTDIKARITNQGKGIIIYPDGSSRETLIHRKQAALEEKMDEKNNLRWIIRSEGWDRQSNGVPFTIFHYNLPHSVGADELVRFYKGYRQDVIVGQDEHGKPIIQTIPYRPLILSSREVDTNIVKLANAEVATMVDPNKALINAAIAIALIFAVVIAGILLFIFMPSAPAQAAQAVAQAVSTTTTTLAHSGIAGVSGG